jgi:hypothetical protein
VSTSSLIRWSGLALLIGGILLAAHLISHPEGQVAGPHVAMTHGWAVSHSLHFYSAVFLLLGVVGLYARQGDRLGSVGAAGFVVALIGTGMYVGTGIITAYLWPVLAMHAPALTEATGPVFSPPLLVIPATAVLFALGYIMLGIATMRAGVLPRWGGPLMALGALLAMMPPRPIGPTPWIVLQLGGVLFAAGAASLGYAVWSPEAVRAMRARAA